MKLNKRVQYALLFCLYLCRAGRSTSEGAATSLGLSQPFLLQVSGDLEAAGLVRSFRGPDGGYELASEPTVEQIVLAVAPVLLLKDSEATAYSRGDAEHRTLLRFTVNLSAAMKPLLKRKIRNLCNELVATELATLNRLDDKSTLN